MNRQKITITVIFLLLAGLCAFGAEPEKPRNELGKWDGFRGIRWGTKINDLTGMTCMGGGDVKGYVRENDSLKVGGAELTGLCYLFYEDRLATVLMKARAKDNFEAIKATLSERYGTANQENPFIENYTWRGGPQGKDVIITLKYNEISEESIVTIVYAPVGRAILDEQKKQAQKGAKEDF